MEFLTSAQFTAAIYFAVAFSATIAASRGEASAHTAHCRHLQVEALAYLLIGVAKLLHG